MEKLRLTLFSLPKELLIKIIVDREKIFDQDDLANKRLIADLCKRYKIDVSQCEVCYNDKNDSHRKCRQCKKRICYGCMDRDTQLCIECREKLTCFNTDCNRKLPEIFQCGDCILEDYEGRSLFGSKFAPYCDKCIIIHKCINRSRRWSYCQKHDNMVCKRCEKHIVNDLYLCDMCCHWICPDCIHIIEYEDGSEPDYTCRECYE